MLGILMLFEGLDIEAVTLNKNKLPSIADIRYIHSMILLLTNLTWPDLESNVDLTFFIG